MRIGLGLLSLLICVAIILILMSIQIGPGGNVRRGLDAKKEAKQLAGFSEDGTRATQSATYQEERKSNGKLSGLLITSVVPGAALEKYFGLTTGDVIVEVNGMAMQDIPSDDGGLAWDWTIEAFQKRQQIVVLRNGRRLVLPQPPGAAAANVSAAPPAAPAAGEVTTPAEAKPDTADATEPDDRTSLQRQLDSIRVPTH